MVQARYGQAVQAGVVGVITLQGVSAGVVTITALESKLDRSRSAQPPVSEANIRTGVPALAVGTTPQTEIANEDPP